jgi:hypothetical protein
MAQQIQSIIKSAFCGLALLCAAATTVEAQGYSSGLTFGRPLIKGGVCVGAGVCVEGVTDIPNSSNPEAINVTFTTAPNDITTLIMTFSLNDLKNSQPDQVALFTNAAGTYQFDAEYDLTSPGFQQLNLLPNAAILPSTPGTVVINGDQVTVYFSYYYAQN